MPNKGVDIMNKETDTYRIYKHLMKVLKEMPRMKIIFLSLCTSIVCGLIYTFVAYAETILLLFAISTSVLLYNVLYFVYKKLKGLTKYMKW
jgi:hypothetical protein